MKILKLFIYLLVSSTLVIACSDDDHDITQVQNPANIHSKYPFLYASGDSVYMSWIERDEKTNKSSLKYARYVDESWRSPKTIAEDSTWFINWADFPSIIVDKNGPMAAHWLDKIPGGTYAYNVNISLAQSSQKWSKAIVPHNDGTATEHGFVSMIPWNKNTILAVWLDGRRTANRSDEEYYNTDKAMTLRAALINKSGNIQQRFLIDESVCDCCQTSLTKTPEGAIIAYRNRTDQEVRDIYTSRFDGSQWSNPEPVHNDGWEIAACPVNGPAIASDGSVVAVTWHTLADDNPRTQIAVSPSFGTTFSEPMVLNEKSSLGRVDVAVRDGQIYSTWMEEHPKSSDLANLKLAHFEATDSTFKKRTVDSLSNERATGFPQMELMDGRLLFAWTSLDSASSKVKTMSASLPLSFPDH